MNQMISVIITTLGSRTHLASVLGSFVNQSLDRRLYEIIVVDNGDGSSKKIIDEVNKTLHVQIRYIHDTVPGYAHACNKGVFEARGDIVTLMHDDTFPVRGFLAAIQDAFKDPEVRMVGGKTIPKYESKPPFWMELFWKYGTHQGDRWRFSHFLSLVDLGDRGKAMNPRLVYGANFSMRKGTFIELGGFHPDISPEPLKRFQGDGETGLSYEFGEKGYKAFYQPKAEVIHLIASSRFTTDYVKRRMMFGGISDSFSKEKKYALSKRHEHQTTLPESFFLRGSRLLRDPSKLIHWLKVKLILLTKTGRMINALSEEYYKKGFDFHQAEYKADSAVREWIKRKDYMHAEYPDALPVNATVKSW